MHKGFDTKEAESVGLPLDRLPATEEEAAKAEEAVAEALERLSMHEREKGLFDLHGIDTTSLVTEDDPLTLAAKLQELEKHLYLIDEKPAYDLARVLNRNYVDDRAFRLMFLRSQRFDAEKAADLLVHHFQKKLELFGDGEVLVRDVKFTDLSKDDIENVNSGFFQVCPSRDLAGRTIFNFIGKYKEYKHVDNFSRAVWYITMCALRDEETQKNGVVMIFQNYSGFTEKLGDLKVIRDAETGLPKRVCGAHFCFSNPVLWPAVAGLKLFLVPAAKRETFRTHFGKPEDVAFNIQTFGIPEDCCPAENPDTAWHHQWLELQQKHEVNQTIESVVVVPKQFDVLFGKSKKAREHRGTTRCQYLVETMSDRYEQASRQQKTIVADQIIATIKASKGRFLRCDNGVWTEVDHSAAREKISHWFRHRRSKKGPSSNSKTPSTSTAVKRQTSSRSMSPSKRPLQVA